VNAGVRAHVEGAKKQQIITEYARSDAGSPEQIDVQRTYAFSAFAQDRIGFTDKLLFTPGLRFELAHYTHNTCRMPVDGTPRDVYVPGSSTTTAFMPGVGLVYGKPTANVFGGAHVGFAPPRVTQAITATGKDAQLEPERSINYELGTRIRPSKWLRFDAAAFLLVFENQIVSGTAASGIASELLNGGSTTHKGFEGSASLGLGEALKWGVGVDLSARYTLSDARFRGGPFANNRLPYAPLHTASFGVDVDHPLGLGASIHDSFVSEQFADEANTVDVDSTGRLGRLAPYNVVDIALRYTHARTGLGGSASMKNALDTPYVSTRLPDGIFTAGFRQVTFGLRWDHK
jgi:Fe(3+) dicitrate transport protein